MNRKIFSILGLLFLSIILFGAGLWLGKTRALYFNWQPGWMMDNMNNDVRPGYGMMNDTGMMGMMMNNGMMGNNNSQHMPGMMSRGMISGNMMGRNMMGGGMMSGNMTGGMGYDPDAEINVTADEALNMAQKYKERWWCI